MERHRADYKIYVDGKKHFTTSYQYQMNMEKRKSELIENYCCLGSEELLKGEGFHIQNAECINFVWQKKTTKYKEYYNPLKEEKIRQGLKDWYERTY